MKRNSAGFTLVELVVTVAILGVLVGITSMSISTVFSARARRCATEIDAYLSMCRVNSMSRAGDIKMKLYADEDGSIRGRYFENDIEKDAAVFSDARVTVEYTVGGVPIPLTSEYPLTLAFNRSTGGLMPQNPSGDVPVYCTAISISSSRTYVITLIPSTGNHFIS